MKLLKGNKFDIPCIANFGKDDIKDIKKFVIAIHGYGSSKNADTISAISKDLKKHNVGVLVFALPSHGENPAPLRIENCLNAIYHAENTLRQFGKPISIYGSSFGGYLALLYLENNDTPYGEIVLKVPAVNIYKTLASPDFGHNIDPEFLQQTKETNPLDRAHTIKEKLHIIYGTRDTVVDNNDIFELAKIANCELYPLDDDHQLDNYLNDVVRITHEIICG